MYVEQRFVVDGEIYAQGLVRMRFLKKTGGTLSVEEFTEVTGDGAQRVGHLRAADRVRRMFGD